MHLLLAVHACFFLVPGPALCVEGLEIRWAHVVFSNYFSSFFFYRHHQRDCHLAKFLYNGFFLITTVFLSPDLHSVPRTWNSMGWCRFFPITSPPAAARLAGQLHWRPGNRGPLKRVWGSTARQGARKFRKFQFVYSPPSRRAWSGKCQLYSIIMQGYIPCHIGII